ncbi:MAG: hypothetical protein ACJ8CR_28260 [Roseiflexaceae bacterium]
MNQASPQTHPPALARPLIVRLAPPLSVLALVLFPIGWLAEVWRPFGAVADWLFPNAWAHAVGHMSLFGLLGLLVLVAIPVLRRLPGVYIGLLLLAGVGQESFQMLYKGRLLLFDDTRDLATDLAGGLVALALVLAWERLRRERKGAELFSR